MDQAWRILDPTAPKPVQDRQLAINRRQFFSRGATGIGTAALAGLLGRDGLLAAPSSQQGGALGASHLPAKAKRVIYLFQNGAPTHVDLFDYKPRLHKLHGTPVPEEYLGGKRFSTMTGNPARQAHAGTGGTFSATRALGGLGERIHAPHRQGRG